MSHRTQITLTDEQYERLINESRRSGLGLAVVDGIVRRLQGSIRIASEPGDGTTVDVWLPAYRPEPRRSESPSGTRALPRRGFRSLPAS